MRRIAWLVFGSLAIVSPLAAQGGIGQGTVEIGAFVRADKYPTNAYLVHGATWDYMGVGGRLGYFFARNLALEVDGSYNETDLKINQPNIPLTKNNYFERLYYIPIHLQLVYNIPIGDRFAWMVGGGGSYNKLGGGIKRGDVGFGGMTGLRWRASNRLNFRLEGLGDVVPSGFDAKSNTYLAAQVGASLMLGGKSCDHATDMVSIRPTSANLRPGQTQSFAATATYCGEPDQVVYRLTGPGTLDSMSGLYTATTTGSAQVIAYSRKGKMTSAAAITVTTPAPAAPPPPPPPPPPHRPRRRRRRQPRTTISTWRWCTSASTTPT